MAVGLKAGDSHPVQLDVLHSWDMKETAGPPYLSHGEVLPEGLQ